MLNVVSFSGGKDSTAMLLRMYEEGMKVDRIVCVDTTKEFPQMYDHIEKVQKMIPDKIEIVSFDYDYFFKDYVKQKGKRKGEQGYGFPTMRNRWCTRLKVKAINDLKKTITEPYRDVIGIAWDERERVKPNTNNLYPLVDWKMTEQECLDYCYKRGLDWGGLYKKMWRVSCWCCPLSRVSELEVLFNEYPELWEELREMQAVSKYDFKNDKLVDYYTIKFMTKKYL